MADRSQPDANNIHSLIAVSNADGISPVTLWADPTTHALVTSGGGGGGTGGADVQYAAGTAQATPTGTVALGWDGSNVQAIKTTAAGVVNIAPITSIGSPNSDGFTAGANVQYTDAFNLMFNGSAWDRVRGDTTNGLFVNVKSSVLPTGAALDTTLTGGTQQTKLTDGTNTTNVLKSDGTSAGQNALISGQAYLSVPFTTTTVQSVATTDAGNYTWVSVHQTTQGTSSLITFQTSDDNINWVSQTLIDSQSIGGNTQITAAVANRIYHGPLMGRYFRLNVTGISAGTTAGTVVFWSGSRQFNSMSMAASQSGTWSVGSSSATGGAVPANAFYMAGNLAGNLTGATLIAPNDGQTVQNGLYTTTAGIGYNGTTYDRIRNTTALTALASAARTTTTASSDLTNWNFRGIRVALNVTAASGTGGLQLQIQGKDSAISNTYYAINATPVAVTTTGVTVYDLYPGALTVQGGITQVTAGLLSRVFRMNVIHGDASSYTYSVSFDAIL